jgi:hypothetical protein
MIAGGDSVVSKVSEVTDGGLRLERFFLHSSLFFITFVFTQVFVQQQRGRSDDERASKRA